MKSVYNKSFISWSFRRSCKLIPHIEHYKEHIFLSCTYIQILIWRYNFLHILSFNWIKAKLFSFALFKLLYPIGGKTPNKWNVCHSYWLINKCLDRFRSLYIISLTFFSTVCRIWFYAILSACNIYCIYKALQSLTLISVECNTSISLLSTDLSTKSNFSFWRAFLYLSADALIWKFGQP